MKRLSTFLTLTLFPFCLNSLSSAQIYISGPLSGVLEDTTYIVEDNISVQFGDSLTILPGAIFLFDSIYTFNIYGYLSAIGTEEDSIYFQPIADSLLWGSIIFESGSSHESILSYCYITGASTSAINCYSVDITISHCTITGNFANWGGGIYCSSANATISECVVTDNQCVNNGGGIYCTHAHPTILNCTILRNSSNIGGGGSGRGGGGVCCNHLSSPVIEGCTISDNYCAENGGGISINDNSHVEILDCTINDNTADSSGGGIFCAVNCNIAVSGAEISANAALNGGGIYLISNDSLGINHCEIRDNSAIENGGGIGCYSSSPAINHCTISGNTANSDGGGFFCSSSDPTVVNTIIEGNHGGGGIYFYNADSTAITYGDFFNNEGGNFTGFGTPPRLGEIATVNANGDSCDLYYNIFLDPLFVDPAGGDFNLLWGSPCIDAGDPGSPLDPDSTITDIGAFYFDQSSGINSCHEPGQPSEFRLLPNFPNPFNPTTTISFELPVACFAKLEVFDINGRRVGADFKPAPTPGSWYPPGIHQISFDGSALSSGVYIYRLRAGEFKAAGKMVLVR